MRDHEAQMNVQATRDPSVSFWGKIVHFPLTRLVLATLMVLLAVALVQMLVLWGGSVFGLKDQPITALLYYAAYLLLTSVAATGSYRLYVQWVEQRPAGEVGRQGAGREALVGVALGGGLMLVVIAILALVGAYRIVGVNSSMLLVAALANDVAGAFVEEILLRAIVLRIVEEVTGTWWAIVISALLFSGLQLLDGDKGLLLALRIGIEATLLLSTAWLLTRRLWLAVGIHAAWDFVQGGIFGAGAHTSGLLQGQLRGSPLLTGGMAGVEASLVAFVLVVAVSLYLLLHAHQRLSILPPIWRAQKIRPDQTKLL